jgi:pyridoxamine 5'-phosphate oxidase
MTDDWVSLLRDALAGEYGQKPRVGALASVDGDGRPRVRSVVCRRMTDDGATWFASDGRSGKNAHLRAHPAAEVVFWLPRRQEQFRVLGRIEVLDAAGESPDRLSLWREMSDAGRALFAWPDPGTERATDLMAFPQRLAVGVPPPATFEVLVLRPEQVERLAVLFHPHNRRRWRAVDGWRGVALNP